MLTCMLPAALSHSRRRSLPRAADSTRSRSSTRSSPAGRAFLQLRDKTSVDGGAPRAGRRRRARARTRAGARADRQRPPDLARLSGADGVHVGQDDLPVDEARRIVGPRRDRRRVDARRGADRRGRGARAPSYIAVGPIYGTATKDTGYSARGLAIWCGTPRRRRGGRSSRSAASRWSARRRCWPPAPRRSRSFPICSRGDPAAMVRAFLTRLASIGPQP